MARNDRRGAETRLCRGFGGVPHFLLLPPRLGGQGVDEEGGGSGIRLDPSYGCVTIPNPPRADTAVDFRPSAKRSRRATRSGCSHLFCDSLRTSWPATSSGVFNFWASTSTSLVSASCGVAAPLTLPSLSIASSRKSFQTNPPVCLFLQLLNTVGVARRGLPADGLPGHGNALIVASHYLS